MTDRQKALRLKALRLLRRWGRGSSGRVLSSIDLIEGLFYGEENGRPIFHADPNKPQWDERDYFVLSKMSALPALYAVLESVGYHLPDGLPSMPDRKIPGIEVSLNDHGMGIAAAVGLADMLQMERKPQHVFCLAGDYELDKGLSWEAILTAGERRLDRLCLIVDENDVRDLQLQKRFEAMGWKALKLLNAHSYDDIVYAYQRARITQRKPTLSWAPTVKSKGVPFAERKPEYDDVVFSDPEMNEIERLLANPLTE